MKNANISIATKIIFQIYFNEKTNIMKEKMKRIIKREIQSAND